jgi:plastocyanin
MQLTLATARLQIYRSSLGVALLSLALAGSAAAQSDGNSRMSVTVAFGTGLNTAQPGNAANHHVLPRIIEIKAGGVVNFAVAGFHQISIYEPGVRPEDILVPAMGVFINDPMGLYYQGINPAGGPLATPATTSPSNATNRLESVSFSEPGLYLVICNVRTHFLDGMYAFVRVSQ